MKKNFTTIPYALVLLLLILGHTPQSYSQSTTNIKLTGILTDTVNFTNTGNASVSLIRAQDSILCAHTRTNQDGLFNINATDTGQYLILIAHPSFAIHIDEINVKAQPLDMGNISLTSKEQMLKEVIITDAKAIVIKGDTIEYAADSFKTRAYDNVDELLKKMPGIEVGKDGKIKAYGQEIKHMTVDGEEFFSDDPAVVAKTLRASAVDKVQVYDKKSEQATFTGIDDGERSKAINIKLKDDAKRGYFGKVSAGGGLPSYWENQAMINAFKKKRKMSAYGIMSNTNTTGLDWSDNRKYGGEENGISQDDDGNWISTFQSDEFSGWGGSYRGQGIPQTWTAGSQYSNKWLNDSLIFSGNYRYNNNAIDAVNETRTRYILPDSQYLQNNLNESTTQRERHGIRTTTEYLIDSTSSLKLIAAGSKEFRKTNNKIRSESLTMDNQLLNDNEQKQHTDQTNDNINAELTYRKKFSKKGRTFMANLKGDWTAQEGAGSLLSTFNLFTIDSTYNINQRKASTSNSLTGSMRLVYTEPITEKLNLEVSYKLGLNNNTSELNSFDQFNGSGEIFNPNFSTSYEFNNMQNMAATNLKYNLSKKLTFQLGVAGALNSFKQADFMFDTAYNYAFFNVLPRAGISWRKTQTTSLSFNYNTNTKAPTITQLQPLRNNNDPLNITIGNPELKQTYRHKFSINFQDYKVLSGRNFYVFWDGAVNQNDITATQVIDKAGRRTTQFVNVNGNANTSLWVNYGRKFKEVYAEVGTNSSFQHTNNFINGVANQSNYYTLGPSFRTSYDKDTTFSLSFYFNPVYNINTFSLQPENTVRYWTYTNTLDASYTLPLQLTIGTDISWNIRQRIDPTEKNNNVFLWNAYISKSLLKDRSLAVKLYANDILNQNLGFTRSNTPNFISESTYNNIRRFFMLSVTWNFTKTGAKPAPSTDVIELGVQ